MERIKEMKKVISVFVHTLLTMALLLAGCGKPVDPIVFPSVNDIDSIGITTFDGTEVSFSDEAWIEQFISVVIQAEATTQESIQDVPGVETYGKVDISNNDGITTFFYYIEDEKYYIEQPYQGIYETDVDIDALVKGAA